MKDLSVSGALLNTGAVRVNLDNPFTWTSGLRSPVYCDNRILISHVDLREFIIEQMVIKLGQLAWDFDVIGGTATAAVPWAAFLAQRLSKPMIYIRSSAKKHGAAKRIEGDVLVLGGKKVLVLEDLISTGGSSVSAAEAVRDEMGSEVVGVLSIFQYGFARAGEAFEKANLEMASLSTFEILLRKMQEDGDYSADEIASILKFVDDPSEWFC